MSQSIHGHEVMQMLVESTSPMTKESLEQAINQRFGTDARFHTCSDENMTAVELIAFLEAKGKIGDQTTGYATDPSQICNHD